MFLNVHAFWHGENEVLHIQHETFSYFFCVKISVSQLKIFD